LQHAFDRKMSSRHQPQPDAQSAGKKQAIKFPDFGLAMTSENPIDAG
jgi:hypothetical protein